MRRTNLIVAVTAGFSVFTMMAAKADNRCADAAWRAPEFVEPVCRGGVCAGASKLKWTPPKLPPWLMTRVAGNAKLLPACAVAGLRRPIIAG